MKKSLNLIGEINALVSKHSAKMRKRNAKSRNYIKCNYVGERSTAHDWLIRPHKILRLFETHTRANKFQIEVEVVCSNCLVSLDLSQLSNLNQWHEKGLERGWAWCLRIWRFGGGEVARRILGGRKLLVYVRTVEAAILDFMAEEDWGE